VLIVGGNQSAGGYNVDNSLRFNDGSSDYLSQTFSTPTNNKKYTFSSWIKRGSNLGSRTAIFGAGSGGSNENYIGFNTDNTFYYYIFNGSQYRYVSSGVYRDVSAWYHCVVAVDTTLADADDRVILYINGERVAIGTQESIPQNFDSRINSAVNHGVGYSGNTSFAYYWDGYQAETVFIDGQQLDPTSFGEFDEDSEIWKPIDVSGLTFGTNGFYLPFENSAALGQDDSGNGNNFTVNNLTSIDQTTDTPTNNGVVLNNLYSSSGTGFSEGNLNYTNSPAAWKSALSTIAPNQGKWYVEFKKVSGTYAWFGVTGENLAETISNFWLGSDNGSSGTNIAWGSQSGNVESNGVNLGFFGGSMADGTIVGIALDLDNDYIYFSKNGTFINSGDPTSGASGTGGFALPNRVALEAYMIGVSSYSGSVLSCNFGSPSYTISSGNSDADGYGNFEYAVPSGYYALNTKNLAEYG